MSFMPNTCFLLESGILTHSKQECQCDQFTAETPGNKVQVNFPSTSHFTSVGRESAEERSRRSLSPSFSGLHSSPLAFADFSFYSLTKISYSHEYNYAQSPQIIKTEDGLESPQHTGYSEKVLHFSPRLLKLK